MATLTTKLTADTTLHDAAIKKSAKQVYSYQKNVDETKKVLGNLAQGFGKIAGTLGIVTGAMQVFLTGIENVESLTDTWGRTTRITNSVITELFSSIQAGRFDSFIAGLKDVILNARDAYDALDNLSTFKAFTTPELAKNQAEQDKATYYIKALKNGTIKPSDAEGQDIRYWQDYLKKLQQQRINILNKLDKEYDDAIKAMTKDIYGRFSGNKNYNAWMAKYTGSAEANKLAATDLEKYKKILQDLKNRQLAAADMGDGLNLDPIASDRFYKAHKEEFEYYQGIVDFLTYITDMEKKITELNLIQAERYQNQSLMYNSMSSNIRQLKSPSTSSGASSKKDQESEKKELSLLDQLQLELKDLLEQKEKLYTFNDKGELIFDQNKLDNLNVRIAEITAKIIKLTEALNPTINTDFSIPSSDMYTDPEDYYGSVDTWLNFMDKVKAAQDSLSEDVYNNVKNISNSVNSLFSTFETLSELFNNEDATFIDYFSTITSSIFSAIDAIASLITSLKTISSVMNAADIASTITQYAKAAAFTEEMAAAITAFYAATLGPAGIAPAEATIAAYKALIETSKFASGGIVKGNTTIGDMNLARVNSGEMILNNTQQSRLFNMLNGVATDNAASLDFGNVTFKISGSDLYGTFANYENKKSRVR